MDSREAGENVVVAICRGDRTDTILNPLMVIIMIFAFVVFSIYYMVIVHGIEEYADLPLFFSLAVLLLVIISCMMPILVISSLLRRNRRHYGREGDLRKALMDYTLVKCCISDDDLTRLRKLDEVMRENERMPYRSRLACLMLSGISISVLCWLIYPINMHLGEVSYVLIIEFLFVSLAIFPSITSIPYEHQCRSIEFYDIVSDNIPGIIVHGFVMKPTIKYEDYKRMLRYSVMTLGLMSVHWAYKCIRSMNRHFRSHREMEYEIMVFIRGLENHGDCSDI